MEAKILQRGRLWFAVSASGGWPWRVARVWCRRNETDGRVLHVGVLLLTRHVEVRIGIE